MNKKTGDSQFMAGVVISLITVLAVMVFILIIPASNIETARFEGHEALEHLKTRVLMDDAIDVGEAVHFATTDGYFIYYDGILYQEAK